MLGMQEDQKSTKSNDRVRITSVTLTGWKTRIFQAGKITLREEVRNSLRNHVWLGRGGQGLWFYPVAPPSALHSFTEQPPLAMDAGKLPKQQISGLIQWIWGHQALQNSQLTQMQVPPVPVSLYRKVIPAPGRVLHPLGFGQHLTQRGWVPFWGSLC